MSNQEIQLGVYKHFKGMYVQIISVARHTETDERLVIYIPLDANLVDREGPLVSARPLKMFLDEVEVKGEKMPRFKFVGHVLNK